MISDKQKFATRVMAMAVTTGRELTAEAIEFYLEIVFSKLTPEIALRALNEWATSAKGNRFPAPGELIALVVPDERDEANETATKMLSAIRRKGYVWSSTYRYDGYADFASALLEEFGSKGAGIVDRCGGWEAFCQQFDDQANGNARPQLRDMLTSQTRLTAARSAGYLTDGKPTGGPVRIGDILRGLPMPKKAAV